MAENLKQQETNIFDGVYFTCIKDATGLAKLAFDDTSEKVNKLSRNTLLELEKFLDFAKSERDIKCLLIYSGKPDIFIAGADINEIRDITDSADAMAKAEQGQQILHKLSLLPYPTVAAINGACMGGGLELALACTYRVVSDHKKTQLALPEVQLGIIPGFGGTQRLPRLIGLAEAMPYILTSKSLTGEKAKKARVVDELYPAEFFLEKAVEFAQEVVKSGKHHKALQRRKKKFLYKILDSFLFRSVIYKKAAQTITAKTGGHYPAPYAALEAIKEGYGASIENGLKAEVRHFGRVASGAVSKNLIQLYFTNEALKKEYEAPKGEKKTDAPSVIGVLGAGVMGGGIAWLFSYRGFHVRLKDISWQAIALGFKSCREIYDQLIKIRKLKKKDLRFYMSRISGTLHYTGFKENDIVIEAIVENLEIKKQAFIELENHVDRSTIIATNTSALSVNEMANVLKNPERFIGVHFFNPVNRMPLVEIIPSDKTTDAVITKAVNLIRQTGKVPVVVKDCPGFLVNRILTPYVNEAVYLLQEGASIEGVDRALLKFGMPMGPLDLADNVGLDVGYKVAKILEAGYGERMAAPGFLEVIHGMKGVLGKKTGQGFYLHADKKKEVNAKVIAELSKFCQQNKQQTRTFSSDEIRDRLVMILLNEACRCMEEGVIKEAAYLDMAMIMGTGYPPFRGGVLRYGDSLGWGQVLEKIKEYENNYGVRYHPSKKLIEMATENKSFY